jgi:hypothetical protein
MKRAEPATPALNVRRVNKDSEYDFSMNRDEALAHFARLLSPLFPNDARVETRTENRSHLIEVDWRIPAGDHGWKQSRRILINVSGEAMQGYLKSDVDSRPERDARLRDAIVSFLATWKPDQGHEPWMQPTDEIVILAEFLNEPLN